MNFIRDVRACPNCMLISYKNWRSWEAFYAVRGLNLVYESLLSYSVHCVCIGGGGGGDNFFCLPVVLIFFYYKYIRFLR